MTISPGEYSGFDSEDFALLKEEDWFTSSGWVDNFVYVEEYDYYIFVADETGSEDDFNNFAEYYDILLGMLVILKSTQGVAGF